MNANIMGGTLHSNLTGYCGPVSPLSLEQISQAVDQHLKKEPFKAKKVTENLGLSIADFEKHFLSAFPVRFNSLKLY